MREVAEMRCFTFILDNRSNVVYFFAGESDQLEDDGATAKSICIARPSLAETSGPRAHSLNSDSMITNAKKKEKLHNHAQSLDNVAEYIFGESKLVCPLICPCS